VDSILDRFPCSIHSLGRSFSRPASVSDPDAKQRRPTHNEPYLCSLWHTLRNVVLNNSVGQFLQTHDTGHDSCRAPAYPRHWSRYLQATCIPMTLIRIPARHLHTHDTDQDTCKTPAYPWHWPGYLQGTCIPMTLIRIRKKRNDGQSPSPISSTDLRVLLPRPLHCKLTRVGFETR